MKKILTLFSILTLGFCSAGLTQNPYSRTEKPEQILTLSEGKYNEAMANDSIILVGTALFNRFTNEIIGFAASDSAAMAPAEDRARRFLSLDPIARQYPQLSPYQFASNSPIQAIDLDGLEGLKYDVTYLEKGKTKIKTVVEVDVYIGVSGTNPDKYKPSDAPIIKSDLEKEYNQGFTVDDKKIEFKFNVVTFDEDKTSLQDFAKDLLQCSKTESADINFIDDHTKKPVYKTSVVGVAMGMDVIEKKNQSEQGFTNANKITIHKSATDKRHTEAHEMGHFFLLGSLKQAYSAGEHNELGGIFTYKTVDPDGNVIQDVQSLNKNNIKEFLKNIPLKKTTPTPTTPTNENTKH